MSIVDNISQERVFVLFRKDQNNGTQLEGVVTSESFTEIKKNLEVGKSYIRHQLYLGLDSTGDSPWVVTIHQKDHQVVYSCHKSLELAIKIARHNNNPYLRNERRGGGFLFAMKKLLEGIQRLPKIKLQ